jgi:L-serine dehydratase
LTAISTGGGMIEVIEIDGNPISMAGDYFETLVYCSNHQLIIDFLKSSIEFDEIKSHKGSSSFIKIKSQQFPSQTILNELISFEDVTAIKLLNPVLPVMARKNMTVPFITCNEMLEYNKGKNKSLWELAVEYESARGNISGEEVLEQMLMQMYIQLTRWDGIFGKVYGRCNEHSQECH